MLDLADNLWEFINNYFQLNRVKAAEKEKESLEGPKNEACEFIRQDNELTLKKYTLSQTFMWVNTLVQL